MAVITVLRSGIASSMFTRVIHNTGVVHNVAKTTTPLFKGAFVFGVVNGAVDYALTSLQGRIKSNFAYNTDSFNERIEALKFTLAIASRYAVAKLCNKFFGTKITSKFVHIYTASDIINKTSAVGTISMINMGCTVASQAKTFSIFMATPLFKNAFYFGALCAPVRVASTTRGSVLLNQVHNRLNIEDSRLRYISWVAFNIITMAGACYSVRKICNQYLKLEIPHNYVIAHMLFSFPAFLVTAFFQHIQYDILGVNWAVVKPSLRDSETKALHRVMQQINELKKHVMQQIDEVDLGTLYELITERLNNGSFEKLLTDELWVFSSTFRTLSGQILSGQILGRWMQGGKIEDIIIEALRTLASHEAAIDSMLQALGTAFGVDFNKTGGAFLVNDIKKNASLCHLEAAAANTLTGKDFLAFQTEIENDQNQRDGLKQLRSIGSGEFQTAFARICFGKALEKLHEDQTAQYGSS